MTTKFHFKNYLSLEKILSDTDIEVSISDPHAKLPKCRRGSLIKGNNSVVFAIWDWDPLKDYQINEVIIRDNNDATQIMFELRDKLGVLFLDENVMREYTSRVGCPPPPDVAWVDYSYNKELNFYDLDSIYLPRNARGNIIPYEKFDCLAEIMIDPRTTSLKEMRFFDDHKEDELPF